jgi:hypothetical protein
MTPEEAAPRYLYPSGLPRIACPTDSDGYPTCMGDGGMCGFSSALKREVCVNLPE